MAQDLTLTEKLKKETVIGMLTRTAAHYPNSGHTIETLSVVAEDWYETFKDRLTDKAFIGAISQARRQSAFFPTEKNVFEAAGGSWYQSVINAITLFGYPVVVGKSGVMLLL